MKDKEVIFEELDFKYKITQERNCKKEKVIKITRECENEDKEKEVKQLNIFEGPYVEPPISIESLVTVKSNLGKNCNTIVTSGKSIVESIEELNKLKKSRRKKRKAVYVKKQCVLTRAESRLFDLMDKLLDSRVVIIAKVRLADIINIDGDYKPYDKIFRDLALKHVDYVIINRQDKELICAVELDDATHENDMTMESDMFKNKIFYECGIPLFRIGKKIDTICNEDLRPLENIVFNYFAPRCNVCGRITEVRESISRGTTGERFYGCTGFPDKCRNTMKLNYWVK